MKKKILAIGVISIFLLLSFSSVSVVGKETKASEKIQENEEINILNITGIIGYAYDGETEKPIENAWIILYTFYDFNIIGNLNVKLPWIEKTKSDETGLFYLTGRYNNENNVIIGKLGYKIQKQIVVFPPGEEAIGVDFFLKKRF